MKFSLPTIRQVALYFVTAGLVLVSLPNGSTEQSSNSGYHLPSRFHAPRTAHPAHAIPTMGGIAQAVPAIQDIPQTPQQTMQNAPSEGTTPTPNTDAKGAPWQTLPLRIRVIDGRTMQPISGAEVVLIETERREKTASDGCTPWFPAPYIRSERFRPLVSELHGQLGVVVYKNGYRDSVHLGIRIHPGVKAETTVWMYKLGPGDTRIEPVFYEVPYHHLYLIELAERFRSKSQLGEGTEKP